MTVSMNGDSYNNSAPFPTIPALNYAFEVIESDGVTQSAYYPSQLSVNMTDISLQTGPVGVYTPANLSWTDVIGSVATLGEHAYAVNNYASGTGQVDLFFHPQSPPKVTYPAPGTYYQNIPMPSALTPTNTGGAVITYSVAPALPTGMVLNTSTGVISGEPTVSATSTSYKITAANSGGTSTYTLTFAVTATTSGAYTFQVSTDNSTVTDFMIIPNQNTGFSGPRGTAPPGQINDVTGTTVLWSNSTVVVQVTFGYMPVSAIIRGPFPDVDGVISGNTITFSNVNLTIGNSCALIFN